MFKKDLDRFLLKVQKPSQYIGGELNSVTKDKTSVDMRFVFCFPDTYEVGMSHLGMKILYKLLNDREDTWCERAFTPWLDFEQLLREYNLPLYGLESLDPLEDFDVIGFTLQYELTYTNILNMLDLGGIPILANDRKQIKNLVIAGGPCACNPEPLADFVDVFLLGEGEEVLNEFMDLYKVAKQENWDKLKLLRRTATEIPGAYVPSLYAVDYLENGQIAAIYPKEETVPKTVQKRIIDDFDAVLYPDKFIVPYTETIHDRAILELMRGCIRGCRFCQAGFIYRPLREKNPDTLCTQGKDLCAATGYEEISLSSLSTSDYSQLEELLLNMTEFSDEEQINLSLPSLRIDNFSKELLEKIQSIRKSGLTFAPEAGTQRLRDVINKNISEEEVLKSCVTAFEGGYTSVKLYFMLGLPTETLEDIEGIIDLAQTVVDLFYQMSNRPKGKGVNITVSVSTFVPKPHTPFQWHGQDTLEMIEQKQQHLVNHIKTKKIRCKWHDSRTSVIEAVLSRGDRRLGQVIYKAWQKGCKLDGWSEYFRFDTWRSALEECGLSIAFYANRQRTYDEVLPWDHIDYGISKAFFIRENDKAKDAEVTPNCRLQCAGCGINKMIGGKCFD